MLGKTLIVLAEQCGLCVVCMPGESMTLVHQLMYSGQVLCTSSSGLWLNNLLEHDAGASNSLVQST